MGDVSIDIGDAVGDARELQCDLAGGSLFLNYCVYTWAPPLIYSILGLILLCILGCVYKCCFQRDRVILAPNQVQPVVQGVVPQAQGFPTNPHQFAQTNDKV